MAVVTTNEDSSYNDFIDTGPVYSANEDSIYNGSYTPGATMSVINRVWDTVVGDFVQWPSGWVDNNGMRYPRGKAAFDTDTQFYEVYSVSFTRPQSQA